MKWTQISALFFCILVATCVAVEPNFEDVEDAKEEPNGETVNIEQDR